MLSLSADSTSGGGGGGGGGGRPSLSADSTSEGGGGGGGAVAVKKRSIPPIPPWLRASARGSLAMGQIREYEGPQSALGPDAKYDN